MTDSSSPSVQDSAKTAGLLGVNREGSTASSQATMPPQLSGEAMILVLNFGLACAGRGGHIHETQRALKEYIASLEAHPYAAWCICPNCNTGFVNTFSGAK